MSLIKRLEAKCDKPGCNMVLELDPSTNQPFRDLTESGWSNSAGLEKVLTFCPEHSSDSSSGRAEILAAMTQADEPFHESDF